MESNKENKSSLSKRLNEFKRRLKEQKVEMKPSLLQTVKELRMKKQKKFSLKK